MEFKKFRDWSIFQKIISLVLVMVLTVVLLLVWYVLPLVKDNLYSEKHTYLKHMIESAYGVLEHFDKKVKDGELSLEDAQYQAKETIRDMRYDGSNYFFIDNKDYILQLNPPNPDGEGKYRGDTKDKFGKFLIKELVDGAVRDGETYVEYWFPKPGQTKASPKLGHSKYFSPWQWSIGTGVYIDDVEAAYASMRNQALLGLLFLVVLVGLFGYYMAKKLATPIQELNKAAQRIAVGDLDVLISVDSHDEIGKLSEAFVDMGEALRKKAQAAEAIAEGNLESEIEILSKEDVLGHSMQRMKANIQGLIDNILGMYGEHKKGEIEAKIPKDNFNGAFKDVAGAVNDVVKYHVDAVLKTIDVLLLYNKGDFSKEIQRFPGKQAILHESIDKVRDNLNELISETQHLTTEALAGNLAYRGNADKFEGAYSELIRGINQTLNAVIEPINEAQKVLDKMSEGDFSQNINGEYKGDHAKIKNAINKTTDSLSSILNQIRIAVDQVNSGSDQVSGVSQSISQGATEQASSLEEISSSMTEIISQSKQNAENADQANQIASAARNDAEKGNSSMQQMLGAMSDINQSSEQISKIIKVIDEIAFQTNLLALNAAVEAARAGVHGKGFAVVAEEVRNLAQRSAKAAKETTELIEASTEKSSRGTKIANETAGALEEIIKGVTHITDLIGEITSASKEQVQGMDQTNQALSQIDTVTQANAANAEEGASAAEELSGQARELADQISRFKLKRQVASGNLANSEERETAVQESWGNESRQVKYHPKNGKSKVSVKSKSKPEDIISLDDFGDF